MSHRTILTCFLIPLAVHFVFLAAGCVSEHTADLQADDREEMARIERRLNEVLEAAERKDFEKLDSYHLYGPKFTRFSGSSAARLDAVATRQLEHEGLASLTGLKCLFQ